MDYGYDEEGRRTHPDDAARRRSNGHAHSPSSSASSRSSTSNLNEPRHGNSVRNRSARARQHRDSDADDSLPSSENEESTSRSNSAAREHDSSSIASGENEPHGRSLSSDFSDDVELIVGETAAQSIDEPLVTASDIQPSSRIVRRGQAPHVHLIESGPTARSGRLLLTSSAASHVRDAWVRGGPTRLDYLCTLARMPARLKSLVLVGALHHGKTSLLHMLLGGGDDGRSNNHRSSSVYDQADGDDRDGRHGFRYAGYVIDDDERARGMTLRSHTITTVVAGSRRQPQSHLLTCIDTPGHADLTAEACAGVRLGDVAVFCVDAVESLSESGEWLLRHAVLHEQMPIILVITKVDRLILELKLPPLDAYRKLRGIIDTVNNVILSCGGRVRGGSSGTRATREEAATRSAHHTDSENNNTSHAHINDDDDTDESMLCRTRTAGMVVSPENGTVCFASARLGLFFTLETFARRYLSTYGDALASGDDAHEPSGSGGSHSCCRPHRGGSRHHQVGEDSVAALTQQLWGAITFEHGQFIPLKRVTQRPSFVTWVLEPLYKAIAHAVCGNEALCLEQGNAASAADSARTATHAALPHSPLAAARCAVQSLLTGYSRRSGNHTDRRAWTHAVVEEAWDVLLDVVHPTEIMHRRLAWLQSRYQLEGAEDEEANAKSDASGTAVAIGTMMRRVGNEVVAVVRVVKGVLRCTAAAHGSRIANRDNRDISKEERQHALMGCDRGSEEEADREERDGANSVILYHANANEVDPFHTAHMTGLFLSLTRPSWHRPYHASRADDDCAGCTTQEAGDAEENELLHAVGASGSGEDTCERVRRGEWVRVSEAHEGQLVYITGLEKGESSHFVLVSAVAADLDMTISGTRGHRKSYRDCSNDEDNTRHGGGDTNRKNSSRRRRANMVWEGTMQPQTYPLGCPEPRLHVSLELKEPQKMARLQESLRTLLSCCVGLDVHTEETGEINLTGYGELHLDSALHMLRHELCRGVVLGLSQPYVSFRETVLEEFGGGDGVLAMAGTRRCGVGCVSGRLNDRLTEALEYGLLDITPARTKLLGSHGATPFVTDNDNTNSSSTTMRLWSVLRREYQLDALAAQSIVGRGPDTTRGSSLLFDDTLPDQQRTGATAAPLTQLHWNTLLTGFRAVMSSGPLVAERVHGVGVRVIYVDAAHDGETTASATASANTFRSAALLTSTRAAVRQSLLGARPRLLEPVLSVEILCPGEIVSSLPAMLQMRRGTIVSEESVMATPLVRVRALVPAMDSLGLETQLRVTTHGQALPSFRFGHWDRVPGDPYDASIQVAPLEPAKGFELSRDFVLKTRFRKGLPLNLATEL